MARMKVRILTTRKARLKAALANTGIDMQVWLKANDISRTFLNQVLAGERTSDRVLATVDAFVEGVEKQVRQAVA